jgi:hypothetical protein
MMLMPMGTRATAQPWSALAMISRISELPSSPITEPASRHPKVTSSMRLLPNMSASRDNDGVADHDAFVALPGEYEHG